MQLCWQCVVHHYLYIGQCLNAATAINFSGHQYATQALRHGVMV